MNFKLFLFVFFTTILFSCGESKKENPHYIKVGIMVGPEKEVAEEAKKVAKQKYNLEVELVTFNDFVIPNEALSQGDIDVNAFQHGPYLEEQSKQRGYKLAVVGKTFVYPIIAYSKKIKSLNELQNGSTIAIPNDPTNGGRSLLLLQKVGLIKLRENTGLIPQLTDIVENPKQLKIIEIEAPQLPRVIDDKEVTFAIINSTFAIKAGLNSKENGIFGEDTDSPYVNLIVSREDNKTAENVITFIKAFQSEEVNKKAQQIFKNQAVKGW